MFSSEQWLANAGADFYNGVATQSLRFDDGDSAVLSKTFGSAGDRKLWTFSTWFKISEIGDGALFGAYESTAQRDVIRILSGTIGFQIVKTGISTVNTNATLLIRDPSAWYHLVLQYNSADSTESNRTKLWINGVAQTLSGIVGQNVDSHFGHSQYHSIGARRTADGNYDGPFDGYMADTHYVNGTALDYTSFAEFKNGVLIPKAYSGSYGTNGFYFKYDQVGVGTASTSTIGADTSGNTNHFTSSGIVASDCSIIDSPENNFATFNPNFRAVTANTLSEGNLFCATSSGGRSFSATTIPIKLGTGKWFWEFRVSADGGGMGVAKTNGAGGAGAYQSVTATGTGANTTDYYYGETNFVVYADQIIHNGGNAVALDGTATYPEVYGILFDSDASPPNMAVYRGGTAVGNIDCDNGFDYLPMGGDGSGAVTINVIFNAGQDSTFAGNETAGTNQDANGIGNFSMAVPTGAKSLCTSNLPEPTIGANSDTQADDYFNTVLYTGDNNARSIDDVGFQPDWLWTKSRSNAESHRLHDSSRGDNGTVMYELNSDATEVEGTDTLVTGFDAEGFNIAAGGNTPNVSGRTYVAWNWKANGGTTVTNEAGSIDSTVQANTDAGFSIVTYTGTGSNATVGHGLGQALDMLIVKNRDTAKDWRVWFKGFSGTERLELNNTDAKTSTATSWNGTIPTSTVFSLGADTNTNNDTDDYIAYCFAEVEGYSKFGSYTGNNSADGNMIFTNFTPALVIIKYVSGSAGGTKNWHMYDNKRSAFNPTENVLFANEGNAESGASAFDIDFLSNGFKLRNAEGPVNNGAVYIYMCWAETPFKYATAK